MSFSRLALSLALLPPMAALAAQSTQPNIVFILADDLGWADVGFHGPDIKTPNLDKLAAGGARLEAFYVQPVCSPTRAGLMTGRYPMRHGLQTGVVRPWAQYGLPLEERTLPQALREAGYETAICGKWHLGHFQAAYLPMSRGFDHQYGHYNGALDYYTHDRDGGFDWHRDQKAAHEKGYTTELVARECVRLIERKDAHKPLFLYVPFNAVHGPYQAAPGKYSEPYAHLKGTRRIYAGMIAAMDEAIGQIVAAIEQKGLRKNTLFIFSSDNGGPSPGVITSNGPWRGSKGTLYEGGVRVPAIATWDGHIPAGSIVNAPLHVVDWYPTLLKLAGASLEQKLPLDGRDAWPAIAQGRPSPHDAILLNTTPRNGAIRMGDWKLVLNGSVADEDASAVTPGTAGKTGKKGRKTKQTGKSPTGAGDELFNLAEDPYEKVNLAARNPEKLRELKARLEAFAREAAPPKLAPKAAGFTSPKVWGEFP